MTVKEMLSEISDVFNGADGGVAFTRFKCAMEQIESDPDCPSPEAALKVLRDFHRISTLFLDKTK